MQLKVGDKYVYSAKGSRLDGSIVTCTKIEENHVWFNGWKGKNERRELYIDLDKAEKWLTKLSNKLEEATEL